MRNTLRISNRMRTVLDRAPVLVFVCLIAYLFSASFVSTANAKEPFPRTSSGTVDPWGIVIYVQPNFTGWSITYKLEPGMRQKLVPQIALGMEGKVVSIQVGGNVGVELFAGRNFFAGSDSDHAGYSQSVPQVRVDFKVGSLIVYPKAAGGPLGVWLMDKRASGAICCGDTDNRREETFFPLPESESQLEQGWPLLGQFNLDKNANEIAFDTRYVEVTLYEGRNFQGAFLALPRAGYPPPQYVHWNFGGMGWSDRAASLKVRWKGSPGRLGPPSFTRKDNANLPGGDYKSFFVDGGPEECQKACAGDPKCKAFTWVEPGVQGEKAGCWLKSSTPTMTYDPKCVSGYTGNPPAVAAPRAFSLEQGVDRPGSDYKNFVLRGGADECRKACESDPKCKAFTWVKPALPRLDQVCWLKSSVPAAVSDPNCVSGYTGPVQPGPLPPGGGAATFTPNISGKWQSSIGSVYIITQTGDQFTWNVKNGNEQGSGKLTGLQISASWSGGVLAGSGKGKVIVDATGKATRIEWDNGVVFLNQ